MFVFSFITKQLTFQMERFFDLIVTFAHQKFIKCHYEKRISLYF